MEKRSLFSRIFGNDVSTDAPQTATSFRLLDDNRAIFTSYRGDFKNEIDVRACVDAIARNGAKMHPKHIRNFIKDGTAKLEYVDSNLYRILAKQPNEIQNAYKFYYQVITDLELYNNSIIFISKDENLKVKGLYPLSYDRCEFYEYNKELWIKFKFNRRTRFVPLSSCIHLTRGVSADGVFGGNIEPLRKTLSMKHILDEGIINAIKTTQSIKGIIKTTKAMLKPEDVKKMRDQFVEDFISDGDKSGIGGLDASTDFTPVKIEPQTASDSQVKEIDNKILKYFGISENIITSNYNENEWNAFYESVLEPIGLQMGLEFSNKLFTPTEKSFGNEIVFEANRLQYASNTTKIELIKNANNIMTINELREIFNLPPVADGEKILQDLNHIDSNIANEYQTGNDDEEVSE